MLAAIFVSGVNRHPQDAGIGDPEFTNFIAREFGPNGRTPPNLLQLMNGILDIDPVNVLGFASAVCAGGSIFGFELDSSARDEAVKLVDRALADHKDTLKSSAASVGHMLDLFVKAGWSEALALTFRLDEAVR